ncbi:LemA family protein [Denitromonas ohlonensis]|jgi:LemA protein|uniref:LemA family protein n=2 Tax=Denitromonas TaxID=139331 RepID=A0A558EVK6_9RHOO|nr:LemA family protein [Denitromonas ohlonensis]TVT46841.1 MAG: LemA family protein [Denitromonas halophila]TVO64110.1 LemA family protein [Denitromonas ohlonensis]TVO76011.1 LemA family protein [Denitromonas ohlonensis]TVT73280.1 MAG: LemA family protein [Denitromonas halophila]TVT77397.1 MAG: LemA family protein [Denitromonas halophila]
MSVSALVLLGVIAIALLYGIVVYNNLVRLKHNIAKAWANIDVMLKQRHDELPKLVEVCRQYKQFEESTLTRVIEARSRVSDARAKHDVPALGQAEGMLRFGLGQLFAVAEAYPELKANEHFMQLQTRITALENGIADRREWFNESTNVHNIRIEQFPDLIIARLTGFTEQPLLEFSTAEKADVDLKALFSA